MKKTLKLLTLAFLGIATVACAPAKQMAKMAENVIVECNPSVLEVVAGQINADLNVTYPDGYFHPKAILEVTPVIVYGNREVEGTTLYYQGEKVKDNFKVVPSDGGTVAERVRFAYQEGMEDCYLELRGRVGYKGRYVYLPTRKVADGANTTYMLVKQDGLVPFKADNYQEIISMTEEGQILYTINSSDVRSSQLSSQSIKDFQAALDEIAANERKTLAGTEIVAYASPDGGQKLNNTLSERRAGSAEKAWSSVTGKRDAGDPVVSSIGQDWEGFQELVSKSNIEDKDLILRVLSMYSDPAVRENEIKNMSEVYKELKGEVLPELRRARFIANVEFKNYTEDELKALLDDNINVLDEEALLHVATLVDDLNKKVQIYNQAIDRFGSDRAQFNLGAAYLQAGDLSRAAREFAKVKTQDADLKNATGVIAMRNGDFVTAANCFSAAGDEIGNANMGIIDILNGNYAKAAQELANVPGCCHNTVLAYILTNQLDKAKATAHCQDPKVKYLLAIIAARQGNVGEMNSNLALANANADLAARAKKDVEFAAFRR
ncbi:MAG: hypothetical protein IJM89_00220 [Bacteroidales bacterium]|nr:hypothetical protein [Bacteroidales bacterium]